MKSAANKINLMSQNFWKDCFITIFLLMTFQKKGKKLYQFLKGKFLLNQNSETMSIQGNAVNVL